MGRLADTLRERRRQETVDEIVRTAIELFSEVGFAATSVEDIAEAAGCSPRTFYRLCGSKEDVMFHDVPAMTERLEHMIDERLAEGHGAWYAVTETFKTAIQRLDDAGEELAIRRNHLWLNEPVLRARYLEYVTHAEDVIAGCLRRHFKTGSRSRGDDLPALIAAVAASAYRVTVTTHAQNHSGHSRAEHLAEALATVANGLAAHIAVAEQRTISPPG